MIDAGLLADVSAIIGAHNNPNYAPGQFASALTHGSARMR